MALSATPSSNGLQADRFYPPTAANGMCMTFYYYLFGQNVGELAVSLMEHGGSKNKVELLINLLLFTATVQYCFEAGMPSTREKLGIDLRFIWWVVK